MVYLFFAGISHYLGLYSRTLLQRLGQTEGDNGHVPQDIRLYFCGRGSSMLAWLSSNVDLLSSTLSAAYREGLSAEAASAQYERNKDIRVTALGPAINDGRRLPPPKTEVATGLLRDYIPLGNHERGGFREQHAIVGETDWSSGGKALSWDTELSKAQMQEAKPPDHNHGGYMDTFVQNVLTNPEALNNLQLDTDLHSGLNAVWDEAWMQVIQKVKQPDNDELQAVFIWELKCLLYEYAQAQLARKTLGARA
jgi:hypothetical protein